MAINVDLSSITPSDDGKLYEQFPVGDALPDNDWALYSTVIGENTLSASIDGGKTLSWDKPTLLGNGSSIPASTIAGYAVYKKGTEERYAVATQWTGGQSGLSEPESSTTWKDNVAAPTGANTFTSDDSLASINSYIAGLTAGGVIYFSDTGTANGGVFNLTGNNGLIDVAVSGTSDFDTGYITLMAVPGENPVLQGTHDGTGTAPVGDTNQTIIEVTGDYVRIYGLEIYRPKRYGIRLEGESPHVEENYIHECYSSGIIAGFNGTSNNGLIQYNIVERSQTLSGIFFRYNDSSTFNVDGWTIRRNISFRNGFDINDNTNASSGDADGIEIFKDYHSAYDSRVSGGGLSDGYVNGRWNASRDFLLAENICFYNADDGFDESTGRGLFIGNIAMNNGPEGNRGFKVLTNDEGHFENVNYVGNIAIQQNPNGAAATSSVGFELQTSRDTSVGPAPTKHVINNTALHNNNGSGGTARGLRLESNPTGKVYGNLSKDNDENLTGYFDEQSNYFDSEISDPDITDYTYKLIDESFIGAYGTFTIKQIWTDKFREVKAKVMAVQAGNLYDLGVLDLDFFSVTSADDTTTPADPDVYNRMHWFALDKTTGVPDIGASQYEFIQAPINVGIS